MGTKSSEQSALLWNTERGEGSELYNNESYCSRIFSIAKEIFQLSIFAFGGPSSHLGLAHDRFVFQRNWLTDDRFLELLSITSAIPGPGSTQVITSIGLLHGGALGGLVAFFMWMFPGWIMMTIAGVGAKTYLADGLPDWMAGLAPAAVSLVVIAAFRLWQKACGDDPVRCAIATCSAFIVLVLQGKSPLVFPIVMMLGGITILIARYCGLANDVLKNNRNEAHTFQQQIGIPPIGGACILLFWACTLIVLGYYHYPMSSDNESAHTLSSMFYAFYWMGSIIFGGGQVMLPMLLTEFVGAGWLTKEQFLAGFALIQSLPGPLFNTSTYIGAVLFGPIGGAVAALGLFGPGIMMIFGILPLWETVRENQRLRLFLAGVNAAATGLLVAAIFLLWEKSVHCNGNAAVGLATGLLVGVFKIPTTFAIICGAILGYLLSSEIFNLGQQNFCSV